MQPSTAGNLLPMQDFGGTDRERGLRAGVERLRIRDQVLGLKSWAGFKENQGKYLQKRRSLMLLFLLSWLD